MTIQDLIKKSPPLTDRQRRAMELVGLSRVDVPIINAEDRAAIERQRVATMNQLLGNRERAILQPWEKDAPPDIRFVVEAEQRNSYWKRIRSYENESDANCEAKQITNVDRCLTRVRMAGHGLDPMLRRIYFYDQPCGCANPLYDWSHEHEDLEEALNR